MKNFNNEHFNSSRISFKLMQKIIHNKITIFTDDNTKALQSHKKKD